MQLGRRHVFWQVQHDIKIVSQSFLNVFDEYVFRDITISTSLSFVNEMDYGRFSSPVYRIMRHMNNNEVDDETP